MKPNQRFTEESIREAVKVSLTYKEVCEKIGASTGTSSRAHISKRIKKMGLDTSHMLGSSITKGRVSPTVKPIEDYLDNKISISSSKLKKRLYKEGLKEKKCESCGITHWNSKELTMDIDHIDGNHKNNNLSNLKIVCPNCHRIKTMENNWERNLKDN